MSFQTFLACWKNLLLVLVKMRPVVSFLIEPPWNSALPGSLCSQLALWRKKLGPPHPPWRLGTFVLCNRCGARVGRVAYTDNAQGPVGRWVRVLFVFRPPVRERIQNETARGEVHDRLKWSTMAYTRTRRRRSINAAWILKWTVWEPRRTGVVRCKINSSVTITTPAGTQLSRRRIDPAERCSTGNRKRKLPRAHLFYLLGDRIAAG